MIEIKDHISEVESDERQYTYLEFNTLKWNREFINDIIILLVESGFKVEHRDHNIKFISDFMDVSHTRIGMIFTLICERSFMKEICYGISFAGYPTWIEGDNKLCILMNKKEMLCER